MFSSKLKLDYFLTAFLLVAQTDLSFGAERNVQFSGSTMAMSTTLNLTYSNFYSSCSILLTNTGSTDQKVKAGSFSGLRWRDNSTFIASSLTGSLSNLSFARLNSAGESTAITDTVCSGASALTPGSSCLIRWQNETISNGESWAACAGKLTMQDQDPLTPGVVIASGSIFMQQEAMVMGGVLSGAHYLSGTPLVTNFSGMAGGVQLSPSVPAALQLGTAMNTFRAGQMNIYCSSACGAFKIKNTFSTVSRFKAQCNEICGYGGDFPYVGPKNFPLPMSSMGWMNSSGPVNFSMTPAPAHNQKTEPGNPSFTLNVANGQFAGGMVTEVVMGPLSSICSANPEYWAMGEVDFTFPDFVKNSIAIEGNAAYPGAPPQRLLCSQRHGREDLFFRTGSSVSFPINGGLPF